MKYDTDITLILDKSGSMEAIRTDTIGGVNSFIKEQKKHPGKAVFSLVLFDHVYYPKGAKPLESAEELTEAGYRPGGTTALLDAVGRTIEDTGKRLEALSEEERPGQVLIVIMTDGLENASRDYNNARVRSMIEHQQTKYLWQFVYLGANQDAFGVAEQYGIPMASVANFNPTATGMAKGMANVVAAVSSYRSAMKPQADGYFYTNTSGGQLNNISEEEVDPDAWKKKASGKTN
jgi:uncharacterized protein YegL